MLLEIKQNFIQSSKIKYLELNLDKLSMVQEVCLINSKSLKLLK